MNSDLEQKLKAWKVNAEAPARFRADVWQRIAAREAAREQSFTHQLAGWIALLARPRYAIAFATLMLSAGIATAQLQARETNTELWRSLQSRYVTSIDPIEHAQTMP